MKRGVPWPHGPLVIVDRQVGLSARVAMLWVGDSRTSGMVTSPINGVLRNARLAATRPWHPDSRKVDVSLLPRGRVGKVTTGG